MIKRRAKVLVAFTILAAPFSGVIQAPAAPLISTTQSGSSGHLNGVLQETEFGFYYNSSQYGYGSVADFYWMTGNLAGYKFLGTGAGKGQYVKNNAAACHNTDNYMDGRVYYNSGLTGKYDQFATNAKRNLSSALKNENASFAWIV